MPDLEVRLRPSAAEDVIPGEFSVEATFLNVSSESISLAVYQASHSSLVLEVRDSEDRPILLHPPGSPDERDLESRETLAPNGSITITYAGFLDRSLPAGRYRLRYFSPHPALGGSRDDPLSSEWLSFTVRQMREFPLVEPLDTRYLALGVAEPVFLTWLSKWWHLIRCFIESIFFGRHCDQILSREVDEARTETISNAPSNAQSWNGTYGWRARFLVQVDEANCRVTATVRVRLVGSITAAQQAAWEQSIQSAWSNLFKLCSHCCCCPDGYTILADVQFVTSGEHQVVFVGTTTTDMGNWGASDTIDVRHEFGHMLGALDEYFTVNGVAWGAGRQAGGSIMNNPANSPAARHYDLIRATVSQLLNCTSMTRAVGEAC